MVFEKTWKRAAQVVFALMAAACSDEAPTREEALDHFGNVMAEAKVCDTTNQCVLAGKSNCSCAAPVNASFVGRIEDAVEDVNRTCAAEDFLGDCITYQNPRCEQGQCVADPRQ
ncbi:MAG TPA: hypothetical protein VF815_10590 [Myxococcaceae bacterium]